MWDPWRDATWYATDARKPTAVESSASSSSVRPPRCSIVFPLVAAVRFESKSPNRGTKAKEKKKRKIRDFPYTETEKKRKKRDAVRFANSKLAVKKKKEEKKTLELNPSVFVLSRRFFFFLFFLLFDRY